MCDIDFKTIHEEIVSNQDKRKKENLKRSLEMMLLLHKNGYSEQDVIFTAKQLKYNEEDFVKSLKSLASG